MTVLKWSAPFALAIALAASPAMAEETPHATVLDHRVREANYNDRQVYEIPGVFRIATEIVFAKDEVVEHVALGDTVSWEVAPAANSLFIKPRERAGRTNLTVITRSRYGPRSYRFALSPTQRGSGFYTVVFRYPEQEAAEAQAQAAMAQLAQLKALERGAVKSALDIGVLEGTRNADYIMQGSTAIQPSEVSDNGQFTVMRFPNQRELPAFFIVNPDGSEAIASFDVSDEYVVLHGVYRTIRLRRGLEVHPHEEQPRAIGTLNIAELLRIHDVAAGLVEHPGHGIHNALGVSAREGQDEFVRGGHGPIVRSPLHEPLGSPFTVWLCAPPRHARSAGSHTKPTSPIGWPWPSC
mgnify:CR=1 FL=1